MEYLKHNFCYFLLFGIISLSGISCEKTIDFNFKSDKSEFLIVDGILTNENKFQEINLSKSFALPNEQPKSVSGADVSVFDGTQTYHFTEDSSEIYLSDVKFGVVINKTYSLRIIYENREYTAKARAVPVLSHNSLNYIQYNDSLYYFPQATAEFSPDEAAMYEINADWSFLPVYENLPEKETKAKMFFYILRTIDVNEIFNPPHEKVYFPKGTRLAVKKYSLSPEHEKFIRSLLLETQWNGGNFDTEEDNVYTNISAGAFGFFGASIVLSDTVTVK
ncbi:MAG: DUF4249 domain-containing protein [Chlorobi bacterium]|nr:DUF4249 domain-containing protein [Chlorobiota bacterium]